MKLPSKFLRFRLVTLLAVVTIACLYAWQYRPDAYASVTINWPEGFDRGAEADTALLSPAFFGRFLIQNPQIRDQLYQRIGVDPMEGDGRGIEWLLQHVSMESKEGKAIVYVTGSPRRRDELALVAEKVGSTLAMNANEMRDWVAQEREELQDQLVAEMPSGLKSKVEEAQYRLRKKTLLQALETRFGDLDTEDGASVGESDAGWRRSMRLDH